MRREGRKRGPGPSHMLLGPDHAGNVVGIDPHKRTLTATVADARGGILGSAHFRVSGDGQSVISRALRPATFAPHSSGNLKPALGAAANEILRAISKLGMRQSQNDERLAHASDTLEGAGSQMRELIRLMARSRKVELEIISAQFGPMIGSSYLAEMRADLRDLEAMLRDARAS